jgi:predicted DNA repair protein MutK
MAGGLFLCYEGVEKVLHKLTHSKAEDKSRHAQLTAALADPAVDLVAFESQKIKGAIRTDFVLSAEIIVITLGVVAAAAFITQVAVLAGIAALMTVGVYGLVAGIVKLDDAGLALSRRTGLQRALGAGIVRVAPYLMKALSIAGTAAMFLVGGGILTHGIPLVHHWIEELGALAAAVANGVFGMIAGGAALAVVSLARKVWPGRKASAA